MTFVELPAGTERIQVRPIRTKPCPRSLRRNSHELLSKDQKLLLKLIRDLIRKEIGSYFDVDDVRWWTLDAKTIAGHAPPDSYINDPLLVLWILQAMSRIGVLEVQGISSNPKKNFAMRLTELGTTLK